MGIRNINKHLKDNYKFIFRKVPLKKFRGLRLGIDISIFSYKYMSPAVDQALNASNLVDDGLNYDMITEIFTQSIGNFVIKLMNNGIIPIFVFDGKPHPLKDQYAKLERDKKRATAQVELDKILNNLKSMDPLLRDINMYSKLKKLYKQVYRPTSEHYKFLKEFLTKIGVPVYQAKTEADEVLGYLSINGLVDVIYSDDTDQYAHGCPYIIKELNKDYRSEDGQSVTLISTKDILNCMEMTQEEFTDLCIMLGCDYNKNIKGVGMVGSLKAIKQYRRISNLPSTYNISSLNYSDCLSIFTQTGKKLEDVCFNDKESIVIDFDIINNEDTERFLHDHGLSNILEQLKFFYDAFSNMDQYTDTNYYIDRIIEMGLIEPIVGTGDNFVLPSNFELPSNFSIPSSIPTKNTNTDNIQLNFDFSQLSFSNIKLP